MNYRMCGISWNSYLRKKKATFKHLMQLKLNLNLIYHGDSG